MAVITGKLLVLIAILLVTTLFSTGRADQETATFYNALLPSACFGNKDHGVMIAAVSSTLWENGKTCGKKLRVSCLGATNHIKNCCKKFDSIEVTIVDLCPSCKGTTIDLSQQAFSKIADLNAGKIKIQIDQV